MGVMGSNKVVGYSKAQQFSGKISHKEALLQHLNCHKIQLNLWNLSSTSQGFCIRHPMPCTCLLHVATAYYRLLIFCSDVVHCSSYMQLMFTIILFTTHCQVLLTTHYQVLLTSLCVAYCLLVAHILCVVLTDGHMLLIFNGLYMGPILVLHTLQH